MSSYTRKPTNTGFTLQAENQLNYRVLNLVGVEVELGTVMGTSEIVGYLNKGSYILQLTLQDGTIENHAIPKY